MANKLPSELVKRKVLVRKKYQSSQKFGIKPEDRQTKDIIKFGIINIDKPAGPTSHQISGFVKNILKIKKAGHSGTLDPKVTGVLPVALEEATRIVQTMLPAGKEYVCIMHIHKELADYEIRKGISEFIGKINQLPPIKSAIKRVERQRSIYYIDIIEINGQEVLFRVGCQAGTYIRKLCHDIGQKLGVGAHMAELRRTKAGPFNEDTLYTLQDVKDAYHYYKKGDDTYIRKMIQPVETAVKFFPKIWVMDTAVEALTHGINIKVPGIVKVESNIYPEDQVAIMTLKDELIALGTSKMTSEKMLGSKGIAALTQKVFLKSGLYPRIEKND